MTLDEFSNEFDVLYNNITSNLAPGLNEYEKSVFLTKALDEIVKAYFNPRLNKPQEGYDDTERRQVDFSMLTKSDSFSNKVYLVKSEASPGGILQIDSSNLTNYASSANIILGEESDINKGTIIGYTYVGPTEDAEHRYLVILDTPFKSSVFDDRPESRYITTPDKILMVINEYVKVSRNNKEVRLLVLPIKYTLYTFLMTKPYKRPLKYHAWKLLNSTLTTDSVDTSENPNIAGTDIVVGPGDRIIQYTVRYIRRPRPIRLEGLDEDSTIDGEYTPSGCELDPIIHHEIVQRAVELAKASYTGELNTVLTLGQASETNMGAVAQSSK